MQELAKQFMNIMPVVLVKFAHSAGDQVVFCSFDLEIALFGTVVGAHNYGEGKNKYDIQLHGSGGRTMRIYNIDGEYVHSVEDYEKAIAGDEFRIASLPLRKFMQRYHDPKATVFIDSEHAELIEDEKVVKVCKNTPN